MRGADLRLGADDRDEALVLAEAGRRPLAIENEDVGPAAASASKGAVRSVAQAQE